MEKEEIKIKVNGKLIRKDLIFLRGGASYTESIKRGSWFSYKQFSCIDCLILKRGKSSKVTIWSTDSLFSVDKFTYGKNFSMNTSEISEKEFLTELANRIAKFI